MSTGLPPSSRLIFSPDLDFLSGALVCIVLYYDVHSAVIMPPKLIFLLNYSLIKSCKKINSTSKTKKIIVYNKKNIEKK